MPATAATSVMEISSIPWSRVRTATASRMRSSTWARCAAMVGAEILGMPLSWHVSPGAVPRFSRRVVGGAGQRVGAVQFGHHLVVEPVGQARLLDGPPLFGLVQLQGVQGGAVAVLEPGQAPQPVEDVELEARAVVEAVGALDDLLDELSA